MHKNPLLRIIILIGNYQYLYFIILITLIRSIQELATSISLIHTTNTILSGENAIKPLIIMAVLIGLSIPLKALDNKLCYLYRAKAHEKGMLTFFNKITGSYPIAHTNSVGEVISICTADYEFLLNWIATGPSGLMREFLFIIGSLLYSYSQSIALTNIIFPVAILSLPAISLITKPIKHITERRREVIGTATSEIQELLNNLEFIKSYNLEQALEKRINKNLEICYIEEKKEGIYQAILEAVKIIESYLPGILATTIGTYFLIHGQISAGFILGFAQMTIQHFKNAVPETIKFITLTSQTTAICHRICVFLDSKPSTPNPILESMLKKAPITKGYIYSMENISFSYNNDIILRNISLSIKPGEKIAIIGSSGSGKSTLLNLLLGIYHPQQGHIFFNGYDMSKLDFSTLSSNVSPVFQSTFLLNATIRENIAGDSNGTDEKIWLTLKHSGLEEFVRNTPLKLDTIVDESGSNLSGGQKQRLAIARALYKAPKVLILDEPFSALDYNVAEQINKNLTSLYSNTTIIMVTHRICDIVGFDRIIVMKNGTLLLDKKYDEFIQQKYTFFD